MNSGFIASADLLNMIVFTNIAEAQQDGFRGRWSVVLQEDPKKNGARG
jgi:hypothetical protein